MALVAMVMYGAEKGRICFDGKKIFVQGEAPGLEAAVAPFLNRPLTYRAREVVEGKEVKAEKTALPGTLEHFSALIWHYLPFHAGVKVLAVTGSLEGGS
ncbi:hypothetical protein [Ammonifex thiophilus]|uniref:hypothetical protein n=1 Tax=Ammonifex thiophilus TaxID=444093 RepID=UPI000E21714D|nr:hypothetical protein [Ammonifex thiophilus]